MLGVNFKRRSLGSLIIAGCAVIAGLSKVAEASPITLDFRGQLEDGGFFEGFLAYGDEDIDLREDFGRYRGGLWDVSVTGGSQTGDAHLAHYVPGRALVETNLLPMPAIGLVFLSAGPLEIPSLSAFFEPAAGYDPDTQPTLNDFGDLIPGSKIPPTFGVYKDATGNVVLVTAIELSQRVSEPATLSLFAVGLSWLAAKRRSKRRTG